MDHSIKSIMYVKIFYRHIISKLYNSYNFRTPSWMNVTMYTFSVHLGIVLVISNFLDPFIHSCIFKMYHLFFYSTYCILLFIIRPRKYI